MLNANSVMSNCKPNILDANIWTPKSWQSKPAVQLPTYPSSEHLDLVVDELSDLPALVSVKSVNRVTQLLAKAAKGEAFFLQAGDCAESFLDCTPEISHAKVAYLKKMGMALLKGIDLPVIAVGRLAGQYTKPRTAEQECHDGQLIPAYRGDMINHAAPLLSQRIPDPQLMLKGYACAAAILNHIKVCTAMPGLKDEIYVSHEALLLHYEQALTRYDKNYGRWYDLSTHFPWVGMRTMGHGNAHMEYLRGIANPIGIKIGPTVNLQQMKELLIALDPDHRPGRLTLICRLGAENIERILPEIIAAVSSIKKEVTWFCDPMHGNTETFLGVKTRRVEKIIAEVEASCKIHKKLGVPLGGVHLEATHEDVLECISEELSFTKENVYAHYKSLLDPRLNRQQASQVIDAVIRNFR